MFYFTWTALIDCKASRVHRQHDSIHEPTLRSNPSQCKAYWRQWCVQGVPSNLASL